MAMIEAKAILDNDKSLIDILEDSYLEQQMKQNEPKLFQQSPYYDNMGFIEIIQNKTNSFIILSLNCQSISAKFDQLKIYIENYNSSHSRLSAVCLQETWLTADSDLSLLQIEGYNLISKGKSCSAHGGIAIYLHKNYDYNILEKFCSSEMCDSQFIEVIVNNDIHKKIIIGNIYRPPRQKVDDISTFLNDMNIIFDKLRNVNNVILTGDFNVDLLKSKQINYVDEFLESFVSNGYFPKITFPTRLTQRHGTLIDNFYLKMCDGFLNTSCGVILNEISDHLPYFISLDYLSHSANTCKSTMKTKTIIQNCPLSWSNLKKDLYSPDISSKLNNIIDENADISYLKFNNIMQELVNKHFTTKIVKFSKYKHKKSKWITNGILRSIKYKDKLYTQFKSTALTDQKYETRRINFQTYNRILKSTIRYAKIKYYQNQFHLYKNDMRKTWSTINEIINKTKQKKEFPESFMLEGQSIYDKSVIANEFNNFFVNIGPNLADKISTPPNKSHKDYLKNNFSHDFAFKQVDENKVIEIIDSLKSKNTSGHDLISTKLLKYVKNEVAYPLKCIINQCIEQNIFPELLKIARVIPIHKKDNDDVFDNYRPISILPSVSKIFERILHNQIFEFFTANELFFTSQYGFRNSHSTEFAALEIIDRIISEMDNNKVPLNIYLDLSKAFDTLDHDILLEKLSYYGIRGESHDLIKSYLTNRKQYVDYCDTTSEHLGIKCGVPQGSILGPLFFIIYVNDISCASDIFYPIIYADDTTLSATLNNFGREHEIENNINYELSKISVWLKLNKLSLNVNKTKAMAFHTVQRKITLPTLNIENTNIEFVDHFNFLGVVIDKNLKWKNHINITAKKISKAVGIMTRLKKFLPSNILVMLYNSLFLPYINYGSLIWGWQCNKLIKLQKKAIRTIAKARYNSHTTPLFKQFKILKIRDLCALHDFKFCYKLKNYQIPQYFLSNLFLHKNHTHQYNTRQSNDLRLPAVRHDFAKNAMSYRYPNIYNTMDQTIKEKIFTHSLNGFKTYIKHKFLESYDVICNIQNCYSCNVPNPTVNQI